MTTESGQSSNDKFVLATFAKWAGDFEHCELLLGESLAARPWNQVESPEDLLSETGYLLRRDLLRKREEFREIASDSLSRGEEISGTPDILESAHLRATLWRTGEREFVMQGYLLDLEWQNELFRRAHAQSGQRLENNRDTVSDEDDMGVISSRKLAVGWVLPGDLFIQVELNDFGLIEATGLWTQLLLPSQRDAITAPFQELLNVLGESLPPAQS